MVSQSKKRPDFRQRKHKVGKAAPRPDNYTTTSVSFKHVNIACQSVSATKLADVYLSPRKQTVQTLVSQTHHISSTIRKEALLTLSQMVTTYGYPLTRDKGRDLLNAALDTLTDGHSEIRNASSSLISNIAVRNTAVFQQNRVIFNLKVGLIHGSTDWRVRQDLLKIICSPLSQFVDRKFVLSLGSSLKDSRTAPYAVNTIVYILASASTTCLDQPRISGWSRIASETLSLSDICTSDLDAECSTLHPSGRLPIGTADPSAHELGYTDIALGMLQWVADSNFGTAMVCATSKDCDKATFVLSTVRALRLLVSNTPASIFSHDAALNTQLTTLAFAFPLHPVSLTDTVARAYCDIININLLLIFLRLGKETLLLCDKDNRFPENMRPRTIFSRSQMVRWANDLAHNAPLHKHVHSYCSTKPESRLSDNPNCEPSETEPFLVLSDRSILDPALYSTLNHFLMSITESAPLTVSTINQLFSSKVSREKSAQNNSQGVKDSSSFPCPIDPKTSQDFGLLIRHLTSYLMAGCCRISSSSMSLIRDTIELLINVVRKLPTSARFLLLHDLIPELENQLTSIFADAQRIGPTTYIFESLLSFSVQEICKASAMRELRPKCIALWSAVYSASTSYFRCRAQTGLLHGENVKPSCRCSLQLSYEAFVRITIKGRSFSPLNALSECFGEQDVCNEVSSSCHLQNQIDNLLAMLRISSDEPVTCE